jgi:phosphoglycolate phosphatase
MKFNAFIFDLDGTLLNSLADMVFITNKVLSQTGLPARTEDEILSYIGNGGLHLVQQAVPDGTDAATVDALFQTWQQLYAEYGDKQTVPFPGMVDTLTALKARGAKLGVLSNKFDQGVQMLVANHFPGLFDVVHGERPGIPRKPDPAGLLAIVDEMGLKPEETAYVGDAEPDIEASSRAGIFLIGVSWGFGGPSFQADSRVGARIDAPSELLDFCER